MAEPRSHHPRNPALGPVKPILQNPRSNPVVCIYVLAPTASTSMVGKVQLRIIGCPDRWSGHKCADYVFCGRISSQDVVMVGKQGEFCRRGW